MKEEAGFLWEVAEFCLEGQTLFSKCIQSASQTALIVLHFMSVKDKFPAFVFCQQLKIRCTLPLHRKVAVFNRSPLKH